MRASRSLGPLLVLLCLCPRVAAAQQGKFPWHDGDLAPRLGGISLGDPRARIESLLGPPEAVQALAHGAQQLEYKARGMTIVLSPREGASIIQLNSRAGGDLEGIRVGDSKDMVVKRWGTPKAGQGPVGLYVAGQWAVSIKLNDQRTIVEQIGVGRVVGGQGPGKN